MAEEDTLMSFDDPAASTAGSNPSVGTADRHPASSTGNHQRNRHLNRPDPIVQGLIQQVGQLTGQFQQLLQQMQIQNQRAAESIAATAAAAAPPANDFGALTVKELAKQSLQLNDRQRLQGPENYQQWHQAISIQFRALQIPEFLDHPHAVNSRLSDPQKAALLLTLRNTLKEGPLATIAFETDPAVAYLRLQQQYSPAQSTLRHRLYNEFHSLQFDGSLSIVDFNAKFNTLATRLNALGAGIAESDQINHYFSILEGSFPQWSERNRALLRREEWLLETTGRPAETSLRDFQEDLLAETRNTTTTAAYQLSVLQANYKDKGHKHTSHRSNRQKQPTADGQSSKGSSTSRGATLASPSTKKSRKRQRKKHGGNASGAEEASYASEASDSDPSDSDQSNYDDDDTEPEAFTLAYNLETGTIFGESEPEGGPESAQPTAYRTKHCNSASASTQWLFDTGSTVHICNDRTLFTELSNSANLGTIRTGGGPVQPQGVGTVKISVYAGHNSGK